MAELEGDVTELRGELAEARQERDAAQQTAGEWLRRAQAAEGALVERSRLDAALAAAPGRAGAAGVTVDDGFVGAVNDLGRKLETTERTRAAGRRAEEEPGDDREEQGDEERARRHSGAGPVLTADRGGADRRPAASERDRGPALPGSSPRRGASRWQGPGKGAVQTGGPDGRRDAQAGAGHATSRPEHGADGRGVREDAADPAARGTTTRPAALLTPPPPPPPPRRPGPKLDMSGPKLQLGALVAGLRAAFPGVQGLDAVTEAVVAGLSAPQRRVLVARFLGEDGTVTYTLAGERLGISRAGVADAENRAFAALGVTVHRRPGPRSRQPLQAKACGRDVDAAPAPAPEGPAPPPAPRKTSSPVEALRLPARPVAAPAAPPLIATKPGALELPDAFKPKPIDAVTGPRDYFVCERWKASLAAETCRDRHEIASAARPTEHTSAIYAQRHDQNQFDRCRVCPVGDTILVKLGPKKRSA